ANFGVNSSMEAVATVIRATNRAELSEALKQHARPIVVDDEKIARYFRFFLWFQSSWLFAGLIAYAISRGFQVDFKHTEWRVDSTSQYEIILTPIQPSAPPNVLRPDEVPD